MELPRRPRGDEYTLPGQYRDLEARVRRRVDGHDVPVLFVNAFDRRTRLGPFIFVDKHLVPGAPIAVASALAAAGFANTRVVLQQWTPHIRPSQARLGGKPPELLLVSSMQIHSTPAYRLIDDAWSLGEDRPLILAGGAKAIYEPWDFFGLGPDGRRGADVVVTGEEFVLLSLLDRLLEFKADGETLRQAFVRRAPPGAWKISPAWSTVATMARARFMSWSTRAFSAWFRTSTSFPCRCRPWACSSGPIAGRGWTPARCPRIAWESTRGSWRSS